MSTFHRSGHLRISVNGNLHQVVDHDVTRLSDFERESIISRSRKIQEKIYFPIDPRKIDSYTQYNAKCPVCRNPVYFYQSPDGGRVFFDDLGPPWPKHPCTDNPLKRVERHFQVTKQKPRWQVDGWSPAREFNISKVQNTQNIYETTITRPDLKTWDGYNFFFQSDTDPTQHHPQLAQYKRENANTWNISFWQKDIGEIRVLAYEKMQTNWQYP
jgi:Uri superfamily endonuclease